MNDKCRNCSMPTYRACPAPNVLENGLLRCEKQSPHEHGVICDHCGEPLVLGRFAYERNWKEFWCIDCMRQLLEKDTP